MPVPTIDRVLRVHPSVAVRPEPFGALLYHFGTRQLSFLKDLTLLAVVRALDGERSLDVVFDEVGILDESRGRYLRAVETLMASTMLSTCDTSTPTESEVAA